MESKFTWVPFFEELATKLGEYRDRQPELVQLLVDAGVEKGLMDQDVRDVPGPQLQQIDPFTFFAAFNKYGTTARRAAILSKLRDSMNIRAKVPIDFEGVPSSNPQGVWYFGREYDRPDTQIPALWDLYESVMNETITAKQLEEAAKLYGVGVSSMTQGFYWLRPSRYMPFDLKTKTAFGDVFSGISLDAFPEDYLALLEQTKNERNSDPLFSVKLSTDGHYKLVAEKDGERVGTAPSAQNNVVVYLREMFGDANGALVHFERMKHLINLCGVSDKNSEILTMSLTARHNKLSLRLIVYNASIYCVKGSGGVVVQIQVTASDEADAIFDSNDVGTFAYGGETTVRLYRLHPREFGKLQGATDAIDKGVAAIGQVYTKYKKSTQRRYHQQAVMDAVFDHSLIETLLDMPLKPHSNEIEESIEKLTMDTPQSAEPSLNTILYGPPGTGKTFATRESALTIIDGAVSPDVKDQQQRYTQLLESGRIRFVTFHQSYAYEEFIEGIRPEINESGVISYEVKPGILRQIAARARESWVRSRLPGQFNPLSTEDRTKRIWKCSLGQAGTDAGNDVYEYCIENNVIAISYGDPIDLTSATTIDQVRETLVSTRIAREHYQYLERFRCDLREGDIIVVPETNDSIRAIGRVTGGYHYDLDAPFNYAHTRPVQWLHNDVSIPVELLYRGKLTPPAFKQLSAEKIITEPPTKIQSQPAENFVLIIDEINRGNISNILGELITLLESDKRSGQPNELRVNLPYSKEPFTLPPNLYVLGTMNTADRSIALVDMALRRRFRFKELLPQPNLLAGNVPEVDLPALLRVINDRLELLFDRDHTIGHAYFWNCLTWYDVADTLRHKIIPLLQEYFYDDLRRVSYVLNDHRKNPEDRIIREELLSESKLFGDDLDSVEDRMRYSVASVITLNGITGIYQ